MPKLTAKTVEAAKPSATRQEIPDGALPGLYLIVQPSGAKSWAIRYRSPATRKVLKLTLGALPGLGLADAREQARRAFAAVSEGRDPAGEKREAKTAAVGGGDTVAVLLERFLKQHVEARRRASTAREYRRLAEREIKPVLGAHRVAAVRRRDVIALLDTIAERAPITANRTLALLRVFFNWLASRDVIEISPVLGVKAPSGEHSRDRVLTDPEIAALWAVTGRMGYPMGPLFRLLLLTAQRREEVAGMRWVELDLDAGLWTLERSRTKNNTAHVVPLSPAAVEIIRAVPRREGSAYVFTTTGETHVSGLSKAKTIADRGLAEALGTAPAPWKLHDLRRTASTIMARLGIPQEHVEAVLNHKTGKVAGVAAVYNRHAFADEKRAALEALARFVTRAASDTPSGTVLTMRRTAA